MKPAFRTITYCIYPKDYVPGVDPYYSQIRSIKEAKKLASRFGDESRIDRRVEIYNKRKHIFRDWIETFIYKKSRK